MSNVKRIGIRRWLSALLPSFVTIASAALFLICLVFGAIGTDAYSLDIVTVVEAAVSMFDYFTWGTFCAFAFAILYFVVLIQIARELLRVLACSGKLFAANAKHDISKVFNCSAQIRTHFDTIAMFFLLYLIQALAIYGQGLTSLGLISVIALIGSFAITNLSITYSQENLPNVIYLLVELVRFVAIPAVIAQMFIYIRLAGTSGFLNSYIYIGTLLDNFFNLNFDYYTGKEIVKIIYSVFAESTFFILTTVQMLLLINSTISNLFKINEPKIMSGSSPMKKFFAITKIVAIWIICRCVVMTFFENGNLNFEFERFVEKWYDLIKDDLIPLLGYSLIGGFALLPKFKKHLGNNKKKKSAQ